MNGCDNIKELTVTFDKDYRAGTNLTAKVIKTFANCTNLRSITINNANLFQANGMFYNSQNLTSITFNNSKPAYASINSDGMFCGTGISSIQNIVGLNYHWLNGANNLFANCYNLIDIGNGELDFASGVNRFDFTFANCKKLKNISNTVININKIKCSEYTFYGCENLKDFSNWDFPFTTSTRYMLANCYNLLNISNINCPVVTFANAMFSNCWSLNNISNINISNAINVPSLFENCTNIQTISNLNLSKAARGENMFKNCSNLISVSNINLANMTYMQNAFYGCNNLKSITDVDLSKLTSASYLFAGCGEINNFTNLNLANVTSVSLMFANSGNISGLETLSLPKVTTLYFMFGDSNATNIGTLNYPLATSSAHMFTRCQNLQYVGDLIFPNSNDFRQMFQNCFNLRSVGKIYADSVTYLNSPFSLPDGYFYNDLTDFGGFINIGKGYTIKQTGYYIYDINLLPMPNLSQNSMQNVANGLYNLYLTYNVSNASASYRQIIRMYDTQYNLLTTDEINTIKNKGWIINITNIT